MGKLPGGTELSLKTVSRVDKVFKIFGYLSAKLLNSHGSFTISKRHDFTSGLHLLTVLPVHVTVASDRSFLKKNNFRFNCSRSN
jgi:hypothetical protein